MVYQAFHCRTKRRMLFSSNSCKKNITNQSNWSDLPPELLELILKSLTALDIIRIRAVCTSWMHAAKYYPLPQPPWLMLPTNQPNDVNSRRFIDFAGKASTCYTMTNLFRGFSDWWCIVSSSHGWLVILDQKAVVHLFNPLSRGSIQLPEIGTLAEVPTIFNINALISHNLFERRICKVVLSSDPSCNNNYVAAVTYKKRNSSGLAYYGRKYKTWIELCEHTEFYSDMIFHNDDQLFAVHQDGWSIDLWNLKANPVAMKTIRLRSTVRFLYEAISCERYASYLVECLGEILLVLRTRSFDHSPYKTVSFRVYRVNMTNSLLEEVECLHDRVLFLGGNQSQSLSTRDFPALEDNSVYFTDDRWSMMNYVSIYLSKDEREFVTKYGGHDLGVYSLEDGVVRPFDQIDNRYRIYPPPFWILPSPLK